MQWWKKENLKIESKMADITITRAKAALTNLIETFI